MRFRNILEDILEEQYKSSTYPGFYYKTPGGYWQLSFDVAKKPKDAVEVSTIYPYRSVGGVPNTLTSSEMTDLQTLNFNPNKNFGSTSFTGPTQKNADALKRNNSNFGINTNAGLKVKSNYGAPLFDPPLGWEQMEKSFTKFREPLGRKDGSVVGKYRTIPAQVNQYYWDPEVSTGKNNQQMDRNGNISYIESKGAWVKKGLDNVNKWRDVPAGYLPSEYEKALEWKRTFGRGARTFGSGSTSRTVNMGTIDPYYQKEFPLGISQEDLASRAKFIKANKDRDALARYETLKADKEKLNKIDSIDPEYYLRKNKINNILYIDNLNKIDIFYDRYVEKQQESGESGFDWLGFAVTVASFIPITAPFARVVSGGLGLMKAIEKYHKGNVASAGLELLFTLVPSVSKVASKANILNAIKVGDNSIALKQVLEENSDEWFSAVKTAIANKIENSTAKALSTATADAINKEMKDSLGDFSAKHASKIYAKTVDNKKKKEQEI